MMGERRARNFLIQRNNLGRYSAKSILSILSSSYPSKENNNNNNNGYWELRILSSVRTMIAGSQASNSQRIDYVSVKIRKKRINNSGSLFMDGKKFKS